MRSSSLVVTPGCAARSSASSVSMTSRHAVAIFCSSVHDLTLTLIGRRPSSRHLPGQAHERDQVREHHVGRTEAVDVIQARALAVVLDEGGGQRVVVAQAALDRDLLVVLALDDDAAILVAEGIALG